MPDRVLRQFGFKQTVPQESRCNRERSHGKDFKAKTGGTPQPILERWEQRENLVGGEADDGVIDAAYVAWYSRHSIRYLTRDGGALGTLVRNIINSTLSFD